jgi:hypothetical protein
MSATVNIIEPVVDMSTPPVVHETGRDDSYAVCRPPLHVLVEQN